MVSLIMLLIVYAMNFIKLNIYILLILQIIVGILLYFGVSYIIKSENLRYIIDTIKTKIGRK